MSLLEILGKISAAALVLFTRLITAPRGIWRGTDPSDHQRIYFANHTSNGDLVILWAVLPPAIRTNTRPVAAADYWLKNKLREFIGRYVFHTVLIDRRSEERTDNPVELMVSALDDGSSLIIFPEGLRHMGPELISPFKTGLYHLAKARPEIDLVPAWIENLNSVLPKGEVVPVPLICSVTFGEPIRIKNRESKAKFLKRAEDSLTSLCPAARGHDV